MRAIILILLLVILLMLVYSRKKKAKALLDRQVPENDMDALLKEHVSFYQKLNVADQQVFRSRVQHFLDTTLITPVGIPEIAILDKLYVASSAIIPIFHFKDWAYNNLDEVLLYPDTFATDYDVKKQGRNVLGMVGEGAMHRMMILSLPSLRQGFEQQGAGNTGIHEFVHLLDKADGATDGVPEYLIPKNLVTPWVKYMHQAINQIRENDSDLRSYAGTNEAEFFAVISEYFFQKPQFLEAHHPELYAILVKVYNNPE